VYMYQVLQLMIAVARVKQQRRAAPPPKKTD
jgi:hypothetical protein